MCCFCLFGSKQGQWPLDHGEEGDTQILRWRVSIAQWSEFFSVSVSPKEDKTLPLLFFFHSLFSFAWIFVFALFTLLCVAIAIALSRLHLSSFPDLSLFFFVFDLWWASMAIFVVGPMGAADNRIKLPLFAINTFKGPLNTVLAHFSFLLKGFRTGTERRETERQRETATAR